MFNRWTIINCFALLFGVFFLIFFAGYKTAESHFKDDPPGISLPGCTGTTIDKYYKCQPKPPIDFR